MRRRARAERLRAVGLAPRLADARQRLRDWVAASGTRLDRDRPTRQTAWPGKEPAEPVEDTTSENRDEDFVQWVLDNVTERRRAENEFYAGGAI